MRYMRAIWVGCVAIASAVAAGCGSDGDSSSQGSASSAAGGAGGAGGATTSSSTSTSMSGTGGQGGDASTSSAGGAGGDASTSSAGGAGGDASTSSGGGAGGSPPCVVSADCDDGVFCNGAETCAAGSCASGAAPSCDDGLACTADACDPAADACASAPDDGACDDGLYCNGAEACDPVNGAAGTGCLGAGSPCDDGISCTVDACDEAADSCQHTAVDMLCNNQVLCDGVEFCNALLGCLSSGAPSCSDGVSCTDDFCDLGVDACVHVPSDAACSNGQFCDGVETCDPAAGAPGTGCSPGVAVACSDGIGCTIDGCDEAADQCAHAPVDAACDDGVFCNGAEACVPAVGCAQAPLPSCDDGRSCTIDSCSEALQQCTHEPNNAACDDGLVCNGQETCSVAGPSPTGCVGGSPVPCAPDGIACTVDGCDEATGSCAHAPSNAACPAGQSCVVAQGGCAAGQPCSSASECQDGDLCNGVEVCMGGICQPGAPVSCDDGISCTIDGCNPATGACAHAPNHAACSDGFNCSGVESCDPAVGCVSTPPIDCDDGVECTTDVCEEPGGACAHHPQDIACFNGFVCDGVEVCDPILDCQPGPAYVCPDDGIACTTEVCNPTIDACVSVPNSDLCGCGQTCSPQNGGCGSFCNVKTCQGKVYACGDCLDNDGDCKVDDADDQCLGPCDNTEDSFFGGIPGQNNSPCKSDCYFDQDTGSGNDDCYWSHKCDPLEVAPAYPPEGSQCSYNPGASIPGYGGTCAQAFSMQSAECLGYCGPLTPNGCDCFGCCEIPGAPATVWLGSENPSGTGSCNLNTVNDPTMCKPCTQVQACLNTCAHCEICVGKPELPPDCFEQQCPAGSDPCGLPGQDPCPDGSTCITGCCQLNPE